MKQFVIPFISTLLLFSGCSSQLARYTPSAEKERASTSYKNVRVLKERKSEIILSTVYLNEVYPNYTDNKAHFLVAFYSKEDNSTLYFTKEGNATKGFTLLLNNENAIASEVLDEDDLLRELMPINNSWKHYYYVRYELPSTTPVLMLENNGTTPVTISYPLTVKSYTTKVMKVQAK